MQLLSSFACMIYPLPYTNDDVRKTCDTIDRYYRWCTNNNNHNNKPITETIIILSLWKHLILIFSPCLPSFFFLFLLLLLLLLLLFAWLVAKTHRWMKDKTALCSPLLSFDCCTPHVLLSTVELWREYTSLDVDRFVQGKGGRGSTKYKQRKGWIYPPF